MTWEQKTEMCTLLNTGEYSKAVDLILENKETADSQAWDMFYSGIDLTKDCLSKDIEKHKIIREMNKDMQFDSMRLCLRSARYEMIVDEITTSES